MILQCFNVVRCIWYFYFLRRYLSSKIHLLLESKYINGIGISCTRTCLAKSLQVHGWNLSLIQRSLYSNFLYSLRWRSSLCFCPRQPVFISLFLLSYGQPVFMTSHGVFKKCKEYGLNIRSNGFCQVIYKYYFYFFLKKNIQAN